MKENYQLFVLQPIYHDADADDTELLEIDDSAAETDNWPAEDNKIGSYEQINDSDVVEVLVLDSIQNEYFKAENGKYLTTGNDEHLINAAAVPKHIVVDKTNEEASEQDDVETYVIFDEQTAGPSDDAHTKIEPTAAEAVYSDGEIDPLPMSGTDDEIVPIPMVGTDDEIIPIPIADNEDFDQCDDAAAVVVKTPEPLIITKSYRRWTKLSKKLRDQKAAKATIMSAEKLPVKSRRSARTSAKMALPLMPVPEKNVPKVMRVKKSDIPMHEPEAGESGDEFPARDSDNEDWPAQQTLNEFPKVIVDNGLLLVKGKKLMTLICK